jgi:hypothetical protein
MTGTVHTEGCQRAGEHARLTRDEYAQKWPHFCRRCDAYGGRHSAGSRSSPPDFDDCADCLCAGKCPRCAAVALDDDGENCGACGWALADADGAPAEWACWCAEGEGAEL